MTVKSSCRNVESVLVTSGLWKRGISLDLARDGLIMLRSWLGRKPMDWEIRALVPVKKMEGSSCLIFSKKVERFWSSQLLCFKKMPVISWVSGSAV